LRGKTDREVIEALIGVMDSRFQDAFIREAKGVGKLPKDYRAPDSVRDNTPEHLARRYASWTRRGFFPLLPFGSDLTSEEVELTQALKHLQQQSSGLLGKQRVLLRALTTGAPKALFAAHLKRMRLDEPHTLKEKLQRRLVTLALSDLHATHSTQ